MAAHPLGPGGHHQHGHGQRRQGQDDAGTAHARIYAQARAMDVASARAMRPFGRWAAGIAVALRAAARRRRPRRRPGAAATTRGATRRCRPTQRAALLLAALTPDEKISLLGGDELSGRRRRRRARTPAERRRAPARRCRTLYYTDGPVGPRAGPATAHAGADRPGRDLRPRAGPPPRRGRRRRGASTKGNDVVYAPTVNIMRTPLGGPHVRDLRRGPVPDRAARRGVDQGRAGAGRDRQRQALRGQQPGGRRRQRRPARRWASAGRQPLDRRRARRRAHAARDLPARSSRRR